MNTLDVNGKLRVGDDSSLPTAGSIRWNAASHDFEGYNGTEWVSFTKSNGSAKYGMTLSEPDRTFETGCIFNSFGIEENWLILGCDEANISGGSSNNSGMVTPFYKTGDSWTAQNSFVPPDNIPGDRFGTDLAITSNELLVSATGQQAPPEGFTTIITMGCFGLWLAVFHHRMLQQETDLEV